MKRRLTVLLIASLVAASTWVDVWAQATAQVSGTVSDQTGALLPGVEVTATQTNTGITRTAVTNETGSYVLPNLALGPYRLEAMLPGFQTHVQTGIVLQVNSSQVINVQLEVGQVAQTVEVQANAALVETRATSVGQTIENERILELPLDGRNAAQLIVLAGAAVQTGTSSSISLQNIPTISVAGAFTSSTAYLLDGALHNNAYDNLSLPLPFPDALAEFQVETSVRSARSGTYAGAAVNVVTKSGTNELHGNLFWFVRNDLFNARNYFATTGSTLKRNQFGGTLGGPIAHNKLFFFAGYQGTTIRRDPADVRKFVPTAAMLAGDFTAFASPRCNGGRQITLGAPYVNNRINPALFSPAALKLAARLPQTNDPCGEITYGVMDKTDEKQIVGRIDHQLTNRQSLFGRFLYTTPKQELPYSLGKDNILLTSQPGYDNMASAYAVGHTYVISPNTINSLRLSANRFEAVRSAAQIFSSPDLGVKIFSNEPTRVSVTNGFSLGTTSGPTVGNFFNLSEELSLTRGNHQMSFGANGGYFQMFKVGFVRSAGNFTFSGRETGLGLADFLAGRASQFEQTPLNNSDVTQLNFGLYAADTWRVTPRLTMNYGLRWEPYIPQQRRNGLVANFDEVRYAARQKSTVYNDTPFGFIYPGDPGFPRTHCQDSGVCASAGQQANWGNMSPRLGLAWDVHGDGRLSIRAAGGMAYDPLTGGFIIGFISPPWMNRVILSSPAGGFDDPWRDYAGGSPFPTPAGLQSNAFFAPRSSYYSLPLKNSTTTRQSWNLSVQQQVAQDWSVSTTYMGSQTSHIWYNRSLNWGIYVPGNGDANGKCFWNGKAVPYTVTPNGACSTNGNLDQRRRLALEYPEVGGTSMSFLDQYENGGTQSYHGLLLSIQRRAARGVNVGGNYTWSHCYGDGGVSQEGGGGNPADTFVHPYNRDADRGNCDQDRRHVFNMTAVAQTPEFAGQTMRALASGWRLAMIYRKSSGDWLTAGIVIDQAMSGIASQRPNQVLRNVYLDKSGKPNSQYLNPAAFDLPALGTLGNMGTRNIRGMGTWQFDVALSRTFQLKETQRVEFRAEAYNLTNSFRPTNPDPNIRSSTFGQIRDSYDPRILQFALKYAF